MTFRMPAILDRMERHGATFDIAVMVRRSLLNPLATPDLVLVLADAVSEVAVEHRHGAAIVGRSVLWLEILAAELREIASEPASCRARCPSPVIERF